MIKIRGRKPEPTSMKILKGEKNKDRINLNEPKPKSIMPEPPEDRLDAIALKEWKRLAPILKRLGILTEIDNGVFEGYCQAFSEWVKWTKEAQEKPTHTTHSGYEQISVYGTLAEKAYKRWIKCATELGMTPSSRTRIGMTPTEDDDDELI